MAKHAKTEPKDSTPKAEPVEAEEIDSKEIAADFTAAICDRIRNLAKPWQQLTEEEQTNLIWSVRDSVNDMVRRAVHVIAADGRKVITAELEKVEVKDGMKAVILMSKRDENRLELIDACGSTVLIVLAGAAEYIAGHNPKADKDQHGLPLDDDKPVADSCLATAAE